MILKSFRIIFFAIYLTLVFLLGIVISLLRPNNSNNSYLISVLLARPSFWILGIKIKITGIEYLKNDIPSILIANHQHNLDLLVAALMMKPKTVSIGKKSLGKIPIFGQFYKLSGNILVDRSNPKKAIRALKEVGKTIREKQISVWIFPEGTRNTEKELLPFKRGAFISAIEAEAPIIPIAVRRYIDDLDLKRINAGTIEITVLPPVATVGLSSKDSQNLGDQLYDIIAPLV